MSSALLERILKRVSKSDCWEWTGCLSCGYGMVRHEGKNLYVHRVVFEEMTGISLDGKMLDHICMNKKCCNPQHLRIATHSQNGCNTVKTSQNKSGFKGVCKPASKKKWLAVIGINGRQTGLGLFDTPEEAHQAYCKAAQKLHGEFANFGEK